MKRVIALGILSVGAMLLMAPGAGAATLPECPPGVTDDPYCTPGLSLLSNTVKATDNGVVRIVVRCAKSGPRCKGVLLLVRKGAGAASSASGTVGRTNYSIAPGQTASVRVGLSKSGRAALKRTGKLRVSVVSVVDGNRTVLGTLTIRGRKHVTGVKGKPGFTG